MSPTTLDAAIILALVPVLAWLSKQAYDGLKTILPIWDRQHAIVHQVAAPFLALALGWIAEQTGVPAITDFASIDAGWINGVLTGAVNAAVAGGIFRSEKKQAPTDATIAVASSRASQPGSTFGTSPKFDR